MTAQRLQTRCGSQSKVVAVPGTEELQISGSVGYALFPMDASEASALFQIADERMYEEKKSSSQMQLSL